MFASKYGAVGSTSKHTVDYDWTVILRRPSEATEPAYEVPCQVRHLQTPGSGGVIYCKPAIMFAGSGCYPLDAYNRSSNWVMQGRPMRPQRTWYRRHRVES